MSARIANRFPLFPLPLVLLPTEIAPLHIFEERYQAMIAECLANEREFGVVWLTDEGLHDVGCACRVDRVIERFTDGRMNLVVRGTSPLRVIERQADAPYPIATVEFLADGTEAVQDELAHAARSVYATLVRKATARPPNQQELSAMDAYQMAATVDFGPDVKQGLLSLRSENARLKLTARLFRAALKRLEFVDRAQARASSNGKVRFG